MSHVLIWTATAAEENVMAKGNNSQGKEKKKPKKDAKAPPVKTSLTTKKK